MDSVPDDPLDILRRQERKSQRTIFTPYPSPESFGEAVRNDWATLAALGSASGYFVVVEPITNLVNLSSTITQLSIGLFLVLLLVTTPTQVRVGIEAYRSGETDGEITPPEAVFRAILFGGVVPLVVVLIAARALLF